MYRKYVKKTVALACLGAAALIGLSCGAASGENDHFQASVSPAPTKNSEAAALELSEHLMDFGAMATISGAAIRTSERLQDVLGTAAPTASPSLAPSATASPAPTAVDSVNSSASSGAQTSTVAKSSAEEYLWLGWTEFESGTESWSLAASDGGHAYGRYQFDDRYCLADFLRYCVKKDYVTFESFTTFFYVENGKAHIKNTERLPEEWRWICYLEGEKFYQIQTAYAIEKYYRPAYKVVKKACPDVDDYSPVLKGTILSISIRDGYYAKGLTSVTSTYYSGISERDWLTSIYQAEARRHPDQEQRWSTQQSQAALRALRGYRKYGLKNAKSQKRLAKQHQIESIS